MSDLGFIMNTTALRNQNEIENKPMKKRDFLGNSKPTKQLESQ